MRYVGLDNDQKSQFKFVFLVTLRCVPCNLVPSFASSRKNLQEASTVCSFDLRFGPKSLSALGNLIWDLENKFTKKKSSRVSDFEGELRERLFIAQKISKFAHRIRSIVCRTAGLVRRYQNSAELLE